MINLYTWFCMVLTLAYWQGDINSLKVVIVPNVYLSEYIFIFRKSIKFILMFEIHYVLATNQGSICWLQSFKILHSWAGLTLCPPPPPTKQITMKHLGKVRQNSVTILLKWTVESENFGGFGHQVRVKCFFFLLYFQMDSGLRQTVL